MKTAPLPVRAHRTKAALACIALFATLLTACASDKGGAPNPAGGLTKVDIPPLLAEAQKAPYGPAGDGSCAAIVSQIRALDEVMGPDLDAPATAQNPGLIERGAGDGGNLITDTIRNSAEGAIPYGGWIKRLTGADKNAKNVNAAITAGAIRRGYLKGLRSAKACS